MRLRHISAFVVLTACFLLPGCADGVGLESANAGDTVSKVEGSGDVPAIAFESKTRTGFPQSLQTVFLPNAIRIFDTVLSGGVPADDAAFQELQQLGVKTLISVDGAQPNVQLARKHGLRYIHLPHSYDGISEDRARELAKAVLEFDGPIYIHCHHGKHRSPAAAVVACISAGLMEPSLAQEILKQAGTDPRYRGLYQSAELARRIPPAVLEAVVCGFPESATLPEMAEAMVHLEQTHERLKRLAATRWQSADCESEPDPIHEALLLKEHFRELLRTESTANEPKEFRDLLQDSEAAAEELQVALQNWTETGSSRLVPESVSTSFDRVTRNCAVCHERFRDVPMYEKQEKAQ